jgi:hypothetical protein
MWIRMGVCMVARSLWVIVLLACCAAGAAEAQVNTVPEPLTAAPFLVRRPPGDLDALTRLFGISDWPGLQAAARSLICVVRRDAGQAVEPDDAQEYETCDDGAIPDSAAGAALDPRRNDVALMWMDVDAFGRPQLLRVVVSRDDRPAYGLDLLGVSGAAGDRHLTELFLSRSPLGRVSSVYTSTREDDPRLAELPKFVQALAGPLFATVGTLAGAIPGARPEAVPSRELPKIAATVRRVGLPFRRASIRLRAVGREPVSSADFAASAASLASTFTFSDVPRAPCARGLAAALAEDLPPVTRMPVCSAADADPIACTTAFDRVLTAAYEHAVASCESGKPSREARAALADVDDAFRTLVTTGTSTTAELDQTFKNRPPTHFSFGAGAAVMVTASLDRPRVTTDRGVIVADPLDRVMTMAFVNWSPGGYDEKSPSIRGAERVRLFLGAALTPDFGPAAGINVLLVRGIGITAGGAYLFGTGADASEIGEKPARPDDPYRIAAARALFVGIAYNFK